MNRQQIFSDTVIFARKQQKKCNRIGEETFCLYRQNKNASDKVRCFLGYHIKDEFYIPEIENGHLGYYANTGIFSYSETDRNWNTNKLLYEAVCKSLGETLSQQDCRFLTDLQRIHDNNSVISWESEFIYFAEKYNLTVPG